MTLALCKLSPADADRYDWAWWQRYGPEVEAELTVLFEMVFAQAAGDLGPSMAHRLAVEYAEQRAGTLLKIDGDLNLQQATRNRVQEIIGQGLEEGQSIGQMAKLMREDFAFSRSRADMVARTETATSIGQGEKAAARVQGRDEKHWVTQGDDRVEDACLNNEAAGWIPADDIFPSGVDTVPQHPRCRCSVTYRKKALHEDSAGLRLLKEARCPTCHKLIALKVPLGAELWCRRCKRAVRISGGELVPQQIRRTVERDERGRIIAVIEEKL